MPLHPLPRDDRNRVRRVRWCRQPVRRHGREAVGPARPAAGDRGAAVGDEPAGEDAAADQGVGTVA